MNHSGTGDSKRGMAHGGGRSSAQSPVRYPGGACPSSANPDVIRVRKKHKSHKARKRALIALAAVLAVLALAGTALGLYVHSLDAAMAPKDGDDPWQLKSALAGGGETQEKDQPFYMLVLGSDAREGDVTSRSDVMILLRVDPAGGKVTMVSIPRDTKVEIEGHGTQKINAAYAFGGAAGAVSAVSEMAGVPISHYAEIHFSELEQLVDDLGGVWVDVPVSNDQTGASNTGQRIDAGYQLLSGEQALAFARERYGYERGDFQRADNQKLVAQAIVKQVLDQQPAQLPGTVSRLAQCVTTDFSVADIVSLALSMQQTGVTFYSATVPSTTATEDGVSYTITLEDEWRAMMARFDVGGDPNGTGEAPAQAQQAAASSASNQNANQQGEAK